MIVSAAFAVYLASSPNWTNDHPFLTRVLYYAALLAIAYLALSFVLQWRWARHLFGVHCADLGEIKYPLLPIEEEALSLAQKLRDLLKETRPQPRSNPPMGDDRGFADANFEHETNRWAREISAKYKNWFSKNVSDLFQRLKEFGVDSQYVEPFIADLNGPHNPVDQMRAIASTLTRAVAEIEDRR